MTTLIVVFFVLVASALVLEFCQPRTVIGILNVLVLQWFCVRLTYVLHRHSSKPVRYYLMRWIVPLTGWRGEYIWLPIRSPWRRS